MVQIASYLETLSAEIQEEHYSGCHFGSWWLLFEHNGNNFRLVFDGRDNFVSLEIDTNKAINSANYNWKLIVDIRAKSNNNQEILNTIKSMQIENKGENERLN
jgi:hypothetical protein